MNGAIAWFARNPVAANLLMIVVLAGGIFSVPRIKQEVFPEVELGVVSVSVPYPGASPAEIEEGITIRIEEQIQGVEGIERITSTSSEGVGTVVAELFDDADTRRVLDDVKNRVDAIDTFPVEAEKAVVQEVLARRQVISVAVSGIDDERTLKRVAERVRDDLSALPEITQVELAATRPFEVSIEVSEAQLRRFGLTFDDVVRAVRRSSLDLPGGAIKASGGEVLLRAKGQAYRRADFERLPLVTAADGRRLLVGDVATVIDGFRETDQSARFDGQPAVLVEVFRVGQQNALGVSAAVYRYLDAVRAELPVGVTLTAWQDDTQLLRSRRDLLVRNGQQGFVLVMLILALFLRGRVALWVAAGVPIALLGTLWLIPVLDVSINMLSLFAFIVVLGILVDDAIVTGENIYRHQQESGDPLGGAIRGTQEIATPVVFGVLTTMAAFAPMLLLPGTFGRLIYAIPAVVLLALAWSLIESKFILPAHLAHAYRTESSGPLARLQRRVAAGLEAVVARRYAPFLRRALDARYLTAAVGVAVFVVTLSYVLSGRLPFVFLPHIDGDNIVAELAMPEGTPAGVTQAAVVQIEAGAEALRRELEAQGLLATDGSSLIRHVMTSVGEQPFKERSSGPAERNEGGSGGHLGEVNLELVPSELRAGVAGRDLERRWRELAGAVPDAVELRFHSTLLSTGAPVDIQLRGPDVTVLQRAAAELEGALAEYPGVYDVRSSFRHGKRELRLSMRSSAEALGLSLSDLGRQVRQAFYGDEAQRIQRGRDDVRVMVRYPESERRSLAMIDDMRIRLDDGVAVPFREVARADLGRGYTTIRRSDRQRVVNVTAEVDKSRAVPGEILADVDARVLPALLAEHAGVSHRFEGEQREQRQTLANFQRGFGLSLLVMFALLAIPLRSYAQPLIILSAIPYGIVGAIWGHLLTGHDLSMFSVIGILAASGVVVNDSLVLVKFANESRDAGQGARAALERAGSLRFRPIALTSLTTFAGLTPVMLERSLQAQFLIPMAISLAFGVLFATAATLVLIPAHALILEDVRRIWSRKDGRNLVIRSMEPCARWRAAAALAAALLAWTGGTAHAIDGIRELPAGMAERLESLSLADAVALGIENNLDVQVERRAPLIAREDLGIAWGSYDPVFAASGGASEEENPTSSVFQAGAASPDSVDTRIYDFDTSISGLIPWLGGEYGLSFAGQRLDTSSAIFTLSPEFRSSVELAVEVPLLKNLIWSEPWTEVRRRRIGVREGEAAFRTRLMDIVRGIEDAYWELIAAGETLRVSEKSLETARALEDQARVQFEVGVVSRVEVTEAEAGVAEREVSRIRAAADFENAEDVLVDRILGPYLAPRTELALTPTESPDVVTLRDVDVEEATELAFEQRPELAELRNAIERETLNVRFARNQRLPELNIQGSAGFSGLAGRLNDDLGSFGGGGGVTADDLLVDRQFGDTTNDFFTTGGAEQWSVRGVLSIPLGNVSERHSYRRAQFQLERAEQRLQRTQQQIVLEVRRAARELRAALEGIEAAERRRLAAEEQLRAERARLEFGESTPFEVLQRERDLVEAEEQKILSQQVYHNSLTGLNRAQGTTLRIRNIGINEVLY